MTIDFQNHERTKRMANYAPVMFKLLNQWLEWRSIRNTDLDQLYRLEEDTASLLDYINGIEYGAGRPDP